MPETEDLVDHGNRDDFRDTRCWDADEHQAVTVARVVYGGARGSHLTELCIFCNIKLTTWREWPDGFTF